MEIVKKWFDDQKLNLRKILILILILVLFISCPVIQKIFVLFFCFLGDFVNPTNKKKFGNKNEAQQIKLTNEHLKL